MIVVDTGPIVSAASSRDPDHVACLEALTSLREPPVITPFVVTEVCYFLSTRASARSEAAFVRSVAAGTFQLAEFTTGDLRRCAELIEQYGDFPLGVADASVIAVAERLDIKTVLTLDRRHFAAVRPRHIEVFELLP